MKQLASTVVLSATLLGASATFAATTPQQKCDNARIAAWRKFQACIDGLVAKNAKGATGFDLPGFAKCRHKYFARWAKFQTTASLVGSTCVGSRYTDNGDQTVTDNFNTLVWEKKDNLGGIHDRDDVYTWSTGTDNEDGTAFATFLSGVAGLNTTGFGGASGWRLPTLTELQTILLDYECKGDAFTPTCMCPSVPCVDPALDAGNTLSFVYLTSMTYVPTPNSVWTVNFGFSDVGIDSKLFGVAVRAVRGGL